MIKTIRSFLTTNISFFLAAPAFVWQVLLLYIPLALIVFMSVINFNVTPLYKAFTLQHFAHFIDPLYVRIIARSLVIAFVSACVSVACAFPVAYYSAFTLARWKNILLFLLILPFWINFLVHIYAWFFVLEKHGLINSMLLKFGLISEPLQLLNTPYAVLLLMIYCYLPFAVMPIYSTLEKFDKRLFEASADLGATSWQTFTQVTLPLAADGMRTGFFLVFVPAFGEFIIPTLMSGGKQMYVGSLITHYFLAAQNPHEGAAFTSLSGLVHITAGVLVYYLFKRIFNMARSS